MQTQTTRMITSIAMLLVTSTTLADSITVYSARNEQLIKPLFDAFTAKTGLKIQYVTDKEGPLLARLKAEGVDTPADLLMTVDAGNLWQAAQEGLLQSTPSKIIHQNIPSYLRDPLNQWTGLSVRARTLVYNTNTVKPTDLSTYEDLAEPKWKGRLCLRTSKKVYNQSLVAMMITQHGQTKAENIVRGWVNNLATPPFSDDTKAMEAVAAGQCDVTIVNTYYFGRLKLAPETQKLPLGIFWPNQKIKGLSSGVHVNISGAGVTRHAKNPKRALELLEWLTSREAQNLYADSNLEFPANPKIKAAPEVASWGAFKPNRIHVKQAGVLQSQAVRLMDSVSYK